MRRQWAEVKLNPPSRFINDIPVEHLAVRERAPAPRPPAGSLVRAPRAARPERDEFDQRGYDDDLPEYQMEAEPSNGHLAAGTTVRHDSFGTGRVLEVRGSGKDQKLLIDFASVGLKTVLARYVSSD
jgi:DNA helicase-2/ATP-dependent DNA helicase PcrA